MAILRWRYLEEPQPSWRGCIGVEAIHSSCRGPQRRAVIYSHRDEHVAIGSVENVSVRDTTELYAPPENRGFFS